MLEKPSINTITDKVGENRYVTALLVAKRARAIAAKRIEVESDDITDCVEIATNEVVNGETRIVKNGDFMNGRDAAQEAEVEEEIEEIIE
ncbi:MAG: DNA-directed RNA polymerase subunit omega [Clostridia bacterium]